MPDDSRRPETTAAEPLRDRDHNPADLTGAHGAIVPPAPPMAPPATDAEAGGSRMDLAPKRAATELGPDTADSPHVNLDTHRPAPAKGIGIWVWVLVALSVLVVLMLIAR